MNYIAFLMQLRADYYSHSRPQLLTDFKYAARILYISIIGIMVIYKL